MSQAEILDGIAPEQYGSRKAKASEIQALNTRLFYDLIRQKRIPETSIFSDLVSNYDLVVHRITSLSLQRVDVPKDTTLYNFTTHKNMYHTVRTDFGDSNSTYGGDTWAVPLNPTPKGLGQGNGAAPSIWAIASTPLINYLRKEGHRGAFKCPISGDTTNLVGQ